MLKIRLMRIGTKKRPFYRVVVVDERNKRSGSYIDLIGTYNPLTSPKEIILDQTKINEWTKKGAQKSHGFLRILGKAPQKPPRKPKKAKEEKKPAPAEKEAATAATPETAPEEAVAPAKEVTETTEPVTEEVPTKAGDEASEGEAK